MTPKEKAKELVDKFQDINFMNGDSNCKTRSEIGVVIAIIAVDEIIEGLKDESVINYWESVKKEIEIL